MVAACTELKSFIDEHDCLSICRCKNGFAHHAGKDSVPARYTDVKFNVSCESKDGTRAIIGEVQILLDCILKAKLKAHELYEVERSLPLYQGAYNRLRNEYSFDKQLLLTGGSEKLLLTPLTLTPFLFQLDCLDFGVLLKNDFNSNNVVNDLAIAIVDRSNMERLSDIFPAILNCFSTFQTKSYSNDHCFGVNSGGLIRAIVSRIAELSEKDASESVLDAYHQIVSAMAEHSLDLDVCFNLFIDLDHSIKKQLKFDQIPIIKRVTFLPRSIVKLIPIFDGFTNVCCLSLCFL